MTVTVRRTLHKRNKISHTLKEGCDLCISCYTFKRRHGNKKYNFVSIFLVHMTVTSKRPTSRSSLVSSSSPVRQCTTVQARQPLWLSTCTGPACSIPSRLRSRAWPPTTGRAPTSATPPPACRLLMAPSTAAAARPLLPHLIQSPAFPTSHTKSACTTPAPPRALTDEGFHDVVILGQ